MIKLEYDVVTGELTEIVVDCPNVEMEPKPQEPTEAERLEERVQAVETKTVALEETLEVLFG